MGDVEVVAERDLLDKSTLTEEIRVLVAGHHASKNTSSAELLRHVSPSLSVISLDEDNIRGYPHPDTVKRLEQYSERVHRTWNRDVVVSLD